jgi:hypothetical protein
MKYCNKKDYLTHIGWFDYVIGSGEYTFNKFGWHKCVCYDQKTYLIKTYTKAFYIFKLSRYMDISKDFKHNEKG